MCGIFGFATSGNSGITPQTFQSAIDRLFKLSESRGKEAAGLAIDSDGEIRILKQAVSASTMIQSQNYRQAMNKILSNVALSDGGMASPVAAIGHSRLVTQGTPAAHQNNQPVNAQGIVGVHNGIITNDSDLWQRFPEAERKSEVDSEVLLALMRIFLKRGASLFNATSQVFDLIEGSASLAIMFEDFDAIILATNNGSLYYCQDKKKKNIVFASEKYILQRLLRKNPLRKTFDGQDVQRVNPREGVMINLEDLRIREFSLDEVPSKDFLDIRRSVKKDIHDLSVKREGEIAGKSLSEKSRTVSPDLHEEVHKLQETNRSLRRCAKCILPETMPFISFNEEGVCNYCQSYQSFSLKGKKALEQELAPYRSSSGKNDCLVAFSGGRDSSYGLHYIKKELGMNPVAYTYDWGMITDLARRNQARICGKLGVEHILVSADINRKRENIRKNVQAWLKKPDLGMIPLFMAGDKEYFFHVNRLSHQLGINLIILCHNNFETTKFKAGFSGINEEDYHWYDIPWTKKMSMVLYYLGQFAQNPGYWNASLWDTAFAYFSSYFIPHNFLSIYDYIPWDKEEIMSTLIREYHWEISQDTQSTWRIGDGTAAFYNYIYYRIAGFTENDSFYSRQIREGLLSRDKALELAAIDNQPRFDSIQWYCDTISLDFERTVRTINNIAKKHPA